MNVKTFLRTCGASALAAAVSLGALTAPALAQDGRERNRHAESNDRPAREQLRQQAQERRQAIQQQRAERRQAAPQQQRDQRTWSAPQRAERAQERGGRDWNRRDNNSWGQARAAQERQGHAERAIAEARQRNEAQAASRARAQDWSRNGERNRSYSDNARNRTYRDGYRDGRTADNRQDRWRSQNDYRSGYRDGQRTEHYRDGHRYRDRDNNHRRWSNSWRRDNRYNWYHYRNANRNVFRLGAYYSPYRNYRYSRLSIGFHLDSLFFGSRYWINDPWQYRLPAAYGPYRWVRYYDDALLVDIYSGEVVDVVYDFFW